MTSSPATDDAGPGDARLADDAPAWVLHVESFDTFYAREYSSLVAMAHALTGSRSHAEDIAQEAMLTAYRRWDDVSRLDLPAAWVRRVCANTATSVVRRRIVETRAVLRIGARPVGCRAARRDRQRVLGGGPAAAATTGAVRGPALRLRLPGRGDRRDPGVRGRDREVPPLPCPGPPGPAPGREHRREAAVMSIDTRAQRAADAVHASARGVDPMTQIVDLKREVKTRQRTGMVATAAVVLVVVLGTVAASTRWLGTDESAPPAAPSVTDDARRVAGGFLQAYGSYDADRATSYLADDAITTAGNPPKGSARDSAGTRRSAGPSSGAPADGRASTAPQST